MNKKEYFDNLKRVFDMCCMGGSMSESAWKYGNKMLRDKISYLGLKLSNVYHANGIGNNNDYYIYKEDRDEDGFVVEKKIAKYYYCYNLYGGMIGVSLTEI